MMWPEGWECCIYVPMDGLQGLLSLLRASTPFTTQPRPLAYRAGHPLPCTLAHTKPPPPPQNFKHAPPSPCSSLCAQTPFAVLKASCTRRPPQALLIASCTFPHCFMHKIPLSLLMASHKRPPRPSELHMRPALP